MQYFDTYILANSSFPFIGAYLSNSKDVYMPPKWLEVNRYPNGLLLDGWKKF